MQALALAAIVVFFYAPALNRGFVSEDFLLVRLLFGRSPWRLSIQQLATSWMGVEIVRFYRPLATLALGSEVALFGLHSTGYLVVQMLLHTANCFLVLLISRRLLLRSGRPHGAGPFAAALLFAIYPLHPNAVSWIASLPCLLSAFLVLAALASYLYAAESPTAFGKSTFALLLFASALACYEQAAMLPLLFLAYEGLVARNGRRRWLRVVPFLAVDALYFFVRWLVLGDLIGGYQQERLSLLHPRVGQLISNLARSVAYLMVPLLRFIRSGNHQLLLLVLLASPILFSVASKHSRRTPIQHDVRLWLFAWVLALVSLSPFSFAPLVPATGRYAYLAALGAALALVMSARLFSASGAIGRAVAVILLLGAAAGWSLLLSSNLDRYIEAGRLAQRIRSSLLDHAATSNGGPLFVSGIPSFVRGTVGEPVAQVFHWGFAASLSPPFQAAGLDIYPLPASPVSLEPLADAFPDSRFFRWNRGRERLDSLTVQRGPRAKLGVSGPARGALFAEGEWRGQRIEVGPAAGSSFHAVFVTRGRSVVISRPSSQKRKVTIAIPGSFLAFEQRIYGGRAYWWIEARDRNGQTLSTSRAFTLHLGTPQSDLPIRNRAHAASR